MQEIEVTLYVHKHLVKDLVDDDYGHVTVLLYQVSVITYEYLSIDGAPSYHGPL